MDKVIKKVLSVSNSKEFFFHEIESKYLKLDELKPAQIFHEHMLLEDFIKLGNNNFDAVAFETDTKSDISKFFNLVVANFPSQKLVTFKVNNGLGGKEKLKKSILSSKYVAQIYDEDSCFIVELVAVEINEKVSNAIITPAPEVEGVLDGINKLVLAGWAFDKSYPTKRIELELLDGDKIVAIFTADKFRADLAQAGLGDGYCSYQFPVPPELCDGRAHQIMIRDRISGTYLKNTPYAFKAESEFSGEIRGLEGSVLVGWAAKSTDSGYHPTIEIYEGEEFVGSAQAGYEDNNYNFYLPLPEKYLDGRAHGFVAKVDGKAYLGSCVVVTPKNLIPWDALNKYSNANPGSNLSPIAGFRYKSLIKRMEALATSSATDVSKEIKSTLFALDEIEKGYQRTRSKYQPIEFPVYKVPDVSVVIPVHNKFNLTYNCLLSLLLAENDATFEVIVVDDGSKDETLEFASIVKEVKHVRNEVAQGFILSCNKGGTLATGKYIVMLNNDTEVTTGWLDEMIYVFERYTNVGMVGSMLLYEDGTLQEAGGVVWETGDPWNVGRNQNASDPKFHYTRQVDYLSGASVMLPKALWDDLEGFDREFVPAYFEDTDLAFRVRDRGLKTIYAPFSKVIHFEGKSSGTDTKSGTKRFQEINRPKFKQRWVKACKYNGQASFENLEFAKDRNVEFRALVIDAETPRPDMDAGSYAAIQEMKLLQSLGFKLTFVPENLAYMGKYTDDLQRMGVECQFAPFYTSVNDILAKRGRQFDVVYITRYYVAERVIDAIRQYAPQAKIVFNNADLHFLRELRNALLEKDQELINRAVQTREKELGVMRNVDLVLSYNETEHAVILSHNLNSTKVALCPWVVDPVETIPDYSSRTGVAFLGGFAHYPNVEAVKFFIKDVMPQLRKKLPGVPFLVYGSRADEGLKDVEFPEDVILKGWVKDVAEVYNTCKVFIAPLKTGAGIKGKVLGALSYGVPCVISSVAAEGTGASHGNELLIADSVNEWVESIVSAYNDSKLWAALSKNSVEFTKRNYSFIRGQHLMQKALEQIDIFADSHNQTLVERVSSNNAG